MRSVNFEKSCETTARMKNHPCPCRASVFIIATSFSVYGPALRDWDTTPQWQAVGYQSQSRFGERFKRRFGLTPSALRRTRMNDPGESLTVPGE